MVDRYQDLLGVQSKLYSDGFQSINRSAIDVSLAGFAQAAIAYRQAIAFQETGKRGRPTVHGGSLHHFRGEPAALEAWCGCCHGAPSWLSAAAVLRGDPPRRLPTPRSTSV